MACENYFLMHAVINKCECKKDSQGSLCGVGMTRNLVCNQHITFCPLQKSLKLWLQQTKKDNGECAEDYQKMRARLWLELPYSGLSNPNWPTDSKQTSCKHVTSVPQTLQAYRQLSANDTKLLSDNILRVITRTVTYCRKQ